MATREEVIAAIRTGHNDRDAFDYQWQDYETSAFISGQIDLAFALLGEVPYDQADAEKFVEEIREGWGA